MADFGAKLGRKQEDAIAALLSQGTIEKAAGVAGIGSRTLYRWLQIPEFRVAYRRARQNAFSQCIARLQQGSSAAAAVLLKVMLDPSTPAAVRIRAAENVLNQAMKGMEIEAAEPKTLAEEIAEELPTVLSIERLAVLQRIHRAESRKVLDVPLEPAIIEPSQRPDRIVDFLEDCCHIATEGDRNSWKEERYWAPVAELYPSYAVWVAKDDREACSKRSFEARLYELGRTKVRVRPDGNRASKQVWVWLGIRLQASEWCLRRSV